MGQTAAAVTTDTDAGVQQSMAASQSGGGFDWGSVFSGIVNFIKSIFTGLGSFISGLFSNNTAATPNTPPPAAPDAPLSGAHAQTLIAQHDNVRIESGRGTPGSLPRLVSPNPVARPKSLAKT